MEEILLNGAWTLMRPHTGETYPAVVPGVVHTDLMAAGVVERPYYRDNEAKYQWIGREEWVYTRRFTVGTETVTRRAQHLIFEGLDTFASVYLNGSLIGQANNMFRRYEYDVTGLLREGENELRVAFASSLAKAQELAARLPFTIPYSEQSRFDNTHRNLIRKCQCHGGWDWGPSFLTCGIWHDVRLVVFDDLKIDYIKPLQVHTGDRVLVRAVIYVEAVEQGQYDFLVELAGHRTEERVEVKAGKNQVEVVIELVRPELWWPVGYGPQTLHPLVVTIAKDGMIVAEKRLRLGLRAVELVQEKDQHGRSFYFKINGRPIFLKGYNWIPADCFPPRVTREVYDDLLESLVQAHGNVVRVWGGGIYEDEAFYDLCDEKGILVWQDFMFACAMYPWNDAFLANVAEEVVHQMRRLAPHSCIILWCGNNENEQALSWYPETKTHRDRFLVGYHLLYLETIGRLARQERPDLPYWPSSPSNGPEEYGDPNDRSRGDIHYWAVWHGGRRFNDYLTVIPRMSSEFGFQSTSSVETWREFMEPEDLNPSSPMMDYHQRSHIGNRAMIEHMTYEYYLPLDFSGFAYLSQLQQAMAMKTAVEHWRRLKPINMGTIIWQLNDIWPANSWSSIEYGGKWKILHYFSKRFFAPLLLSLAKRDELVEVWATSDLTRPVSGFYRLEVCDFTGQNLRSWSGRYGLGSGESKQLLCLSHQDLLAGMCAEEVFLVLQEGSEDDTIFNWEFLMPVKYCPLAHTKIDYEVRAIGRETELILRADRPAFYVWLETPGRRGIFTDNAFLLLPGRPKQVLFDPRDGKGRLCAKELRLVHLQEVLRRSRP